MSRNVSCGFKRPAVFKIHGDARRSETVIANLSQQSGVFYPALDDSERIDPRQSFFRDMVRPRVDRNRGVFG